MRIEHAALYVQDLEQAAEFYARYFGAFVHEKYTNPRTGFSSRFVTWEDSARLELMHKPRLGEGPGGEERFGWAHLAFSVGSREEVDRLTEQLRNDGYRILSGPRTTGDGYYESCILDAEDNRIEITI